MVFWTAFVAGGLLLSLVGVILVFVSKPPTIDLNRARQTTEERSQEFFSGMIERSLMNSEQIRSAGKEAAKKEERKLEFSVAGIFLLVLGATLQFVGTVGQVTVLACGR